MEYFILFLLIIILSVHYLPEFLRERALNSPLETVHEFHRGMIALGFSVMRKEPHRRVNMTDYQSTYRTGRYLGYNNPGYDDSLYEGDFIPYPRNRARTEMRIKRQRILAVLFLMLFATLMPCLIGAARWFIFVHAAVLALSAVYVFLVLIMCERREI